MEPTWGRQDQGWSHDGRVNFAIWGDIHLASTLVMSELLCVIFTFYQCLWIACQRFSETLISFTNLL